MARTVGLITSKNNHEGINLLTQLLGSTDIAQEVAGCGLTVPPSDAVGLASAIERLVDDRALRAAMGVRARERAEERWSRTRILGRFERQLCELAA